MSKGTPPGHRFQTISAWVVITGMIVAAVIFHSGRPEPALFDLLSLGVVLQAVIWLVRHRRPRFANLLMATAWGTLILYFILYLLGAR